MIAVIINLGLADATINNLQLTGRDVWPGRTEFNILVTVLLCL